jgi:hypothetical protein
MVQPGYEGLSVRRQCELLHLALQRGSWRGCCRDLPTLRTHRMLRPMRTAGARRVAHSSSKWKRSGGMAQKQCDAHREPCSGSRWRLTGTSSSFPLHPQEPLPAGRADLTLLFRTLLTDEEGNPLDRDVRVTFSTVP